MTQKGIVQKSLGQRAAEGEGQAVALEPPESAVEYRTDERTHMRHERALAWAASKCHRTSEGTARSERASERASERIRREAGVTWRR